MGVCFDGLMLIIEGTLVCARIDQTQLSALELVQTKTFELFRCVTSSPICQFTVAYSIRMYSNQEAGGLNYGATSSKRVAQVKQTALVELNQSLRQTLATSAGLV